MEGTPELLDLVIGVLQIIAVLMLTCGAYLATRKSGGPLIPDEPGAAASRQNLRSAATPANLNGNHGLAR